MSSGYNAFELYHEFLNSMETTNYNYNQIIFDKYEGTEKNSIPTKTLTEELSFPHSYPPFTTKQSLSFVRDQTSFNCLQKFTGHRKPQTIGPINLDVDVTCANQFVNADDFNISLDLNQTYNFIDDTASIISDNDYYDECPNPVVPGLFPNINIKDENQFLPFDKLPLNPSYISQ